MRRKVDEFPPFVQVHFDHAGARPTQGIEYQQRPRGVVNRVSQAGQSALEHIVNSALRLAGKTFLDRQLVHSFLALRIRYAAVGSPGVLVEQNHVVPHPPQGFGLGLSNGINQAAESGEFLRCKGSLFRLALDSGGSRC